MNHFDKYNQIKYFTNENNKYSDNCSESYFLHFQCFCTSPFKMCGCDYLLVDINFHVTKQLRPSIINLPKMM